MIRCTNLRAAARTPILALLEEVAAFVVGLSTKSRILRFEMDSISHGCLLFVRDIHLYYTGYSTYHYSQLSLAEVLGLALLAQCGAGVKLTSLGIKVGRDGRKPVSRV